MTDAMRWLGALVPLLLLGFGLVLLFAARGARIDAGRALGWSILLGAFGLSVLQFAGAFVIRGRPLRLGLVVTSLVVAALGLARARRHGISVEWSPPRGRGEWMLLAGVLLELVLVAVVIYRTTLSWDAFVTFEARARPAWLGGGLAPQDSYLDAHRWLARADPWPFVPTLQAWVLGWLGTADQRLPKTLALLFFVAALSLLWSAAREDRRWTLAPLLPIAVPQLVVGPGSAASGDAGFPLSVAYLACVLWLVGPGRDGGWSVPAALAAMLLWIAPDGILLWMSVVILAAWSAGGRRLRVAAQTAMPGFVLLAAWAVFRGHVGAPGLSAAPGPTLGAMMDLTRWGVLWPLLLLCVPPLLPVEMRGSQRLLFGCILVPLALRYGVALVGGSRWMAPWPHFLASPGFPALMALSAAGWEFTRVRRCAARTERKGVLTAAALLVAFALPGLEQTARGAAERRVAAPGANATTDTFLAPTSMRSPTATLRGYIDATSAQDAVMFVGTGRSSREVGTVIALLAHPRPFGGWVCRDTRTPAEPLPSSAVAPESQGVLFVYRAAGEAETWMAGRPSDNVAVVSPSERHLVPPPPSLCRPMAAVTRARAALLLGRRMHAEASAPPRASGVFRDVTGEVAAMAEALYRTGAVSGCAPSRFCPDRVVTRAHMALFALAAAGRLADLPPATGVFVDVPATHPLARHVERALLFGVPGCTEDPPRFCPDRPVLEEELPDFLAIVRQGGTATGPRAGPVRASAPPR